MSANVSKRIRWAWRAMAARCATEVPDLLPTALPELVPPLSQSGCIFDWRTRRAAEHHRPRPVGGRSSRTDWDPGAALFTVPRHPVSGRGNGLDGQIEPTLSRF